MSLVSGVPKIKYELTKVIKQVQNVDEYNSVGIQEGANSAAAKQHEYTTRKKVTAIEDSSQKVKINKKDPVSKKTIIIPQTEIDKRYKEILESKKKILQSLNE